MDGITMFLTDIVLIFMVTEVGMISTCNLGTEQGLIHIMVGFITTMVMEAITVIIITTAIPITIIIITAEEIAETIHTEQEVMA
ncbi:hypothetical protein A8B79_11575 [Balneola sp. EhC07]|nr:hypothetical protein A8B79_11575 [Balneola sp. EhC07]